MLGIIGAMAQEVRQLKEAMEQPRIETVAGMEFYRGTIGGKETVVVQSGIGKVSAGICAQILVDRFGVGGIINTGIAGSLKAEINIGDLVMSTDALQHDVDAVNFGYEPGQIPQLPVKAFPTDDRLRKLAMELCARVNPDIRAHEGRVLTGDQFISDKAKKQWLTSTFGGACTEMEGAAIAQAAYLNQVPVLIIRAISDKADDSASMDYGAFEELAILHSVRLTRALIEAWE
ncbi:MAG: 5'-methylthioadenosine/adenosylhomocysteine nucleosidase [Lachnospiraceae bacterium]|jgi:adenosylhomocysteine nucleosidase|nr:5'-methylthioadenosine/adenosylhomocysteine nucleosidase [Lachnospiraceae bacterium]